MISLPFLEWGWFFFNGWNIWLIMNMMKGWVYSTIRKLSWSGCAGKKSAGSASSTLASWVAWENVLSFSVPFYFIWKMKPWGQLNAVLIVLQFLSSQACYFRRYTIFSNFRNIYWAQTLLITLSIYIELYTFTTFFFYIPYLNWYSQC